MNKISKQIRDYLLQEKYLIAASNDENIIIRFQNQLISIFPDSEEDSYCSVCLPTFLDSMPLQKEKLQMICNTIMANQNTIKAILVETGIIIRYDFIWQNSEELHRQLNRESSKLLLLRSKSQMLPDLPITQCQTKKKKNMSKNNDYLDPMLAGASASLYGLENQEAVKESFPLIYQKWWIHLVILSSSQSSTPSKDVDRLPWVSIYPRKMRHFALSIRFGFRYRNLIPSIGRYIT